MERKSRARTHPIDYYFEVAGKVFDLTFDKETIDRWTQLVDLTDDIDDAIDDSGELFDNAAQQAVTEAYLNDEFLNEYYPLLSPSDDNDRYEALFRSANEIFHINQRLRITPYAGEYSVLRQKEGKIFAEMLLACSSKAVQIQANYEEFTQNFIVLGKAGILVDSWFDVRKDYRRGEISINHSSRQRSDLLLQAARLASELSPKTLRPKAVMILGRSAIQVAFDSIKARG